MSSSLFSWAAQLVNRPHGGLAVNLYLLSSLLHLLSCFTGCQFGSGMNERFPLLSITSITSQLSFYPER